MNWCIVSPDEFGKRISEDKDILMRKDRFHPDKDGIMGNVNLLVFCNNAAKGCFLAGGLDVDTLTTELDIGPLTLWRWNLNDVPVAPEKRMLTGNPFYASPLPLP